MAVAACVLLVAGCGSRADEPLAKADENTSVQTRPNGSRDGDRGFVPATHREGDRVVLPIAFPDGTTAELVYPPELDIAELGLIPYTSGALRRINLTPTRGDSVARDFVIRYGVLDDLLMSRNDGMRPKPTTRPSASGTSPGTTLPTTSASSSPAGQSSSTTTSPRARR